MPIMRCQIKGKAQRGYKFGPGGACYIRLADALKQMRAMIANGYVPHQVKK